MKTFEIMKFALFMLLLVAFCGNMLVTCAPGGYRFLPAKCEQYDDSAHKLDGPLKLCTFPKHTITQQEIDEVVKHIQALDLN